MRCATLFLALLLLGGCKPKPDPLPDYGKLPVHAVIASARNLETRGLLWATEVATGTHFTADPPRELTMASVVTVLVHGYNTPPSQVVKYFDGVISYLREDRQYDLPMVIYDWKSTARHWEDVSWAEQQGYIDFLSATVGERRGGTIPGLPPGLRWETNQYSADRTHAATTAVEGLGLLMRRLLSTRPDVKVIILAHSMGSQVVIDALRKQPEHMAAVRTVVLLAPDVDASVFQDEKIASLQHLKALHVFYSRHDEVVSTYSRMANLGFARLGATGPSDAAKLPSFVHVHDVGETLGTSGVHGRYVARDGAAALRLDEVVQ